jgi:uracil-DNA glycosylase family 4
MARRWDQVNRSIINCQACPRLRDYCDQVGREKRRAYRDDTYWARPVPNFGDPSARLLVIGLAPAAHGANRTGRMFTGDRSGEWLYRALHRAGFANQCSSTSRDDSLRLIDCAITAVCHCAPPHNKPAPAELHACQQWLEQTLRIVPARVYLALGRIAWDRTWRALVAVQSVAGRRPEFAHGARARLDQQRWLIGCYHPSQQNTFTGRLTESMLDDVMQAARLCLSASTPAMLPTVRSEQTR